MYCLSPDGYFKVESKSRIKLASDHSKEQSQTEEQAESKKVQ
jgi:hypothetical protein